MQDIVVVQQATQLGLLRQSSIRHYSHAQSIFELDEKEIQTFFNDYQLFDPPAFKMKELLTSPKTVLIRDQSKAFFGESDGRRLHGRGILIFRKGSLYEGYFKESLKHGYGNNFISSGNLYKGQFFQDRKHGSGTFYWFDNANKTGQDVPQHPHHGFVQFYQGLWQSGSPCGNGMLFNRHGDTYIGEFLNGVKHGKGRQKFMNGDFYKGQYVNGYPEGEGEYIWFNKRTYKGQFVQGMRNGFGLWSKGPNSKVLYKGRYLKDKKDGYGIYIWQTGEIYKGQFKSDMMHGEGILMKKGQQTTVQFHRGRLIQQWQGKQSKRTRSTQQKSSAKRHKTVQNSNVKVSQFILI